MTATRRLAAILAADVAGYSRLMGENDEGTLARLNSHRRELIDPKIGEHHGRIVKTTGDGLLVEFASVVDAVRCAVEFQRGMGERNADISEDQRVAFRVGVNLGDVIAENGDIFGDGVNVAARLEAIAEPGGICVSRTVRNQVRDKLPYSFDDLGEQNIKNIARPVRADAMSPAAVAATPLTPVKALVAPDRHQIPRGTAVIAAGLLALLGIVLGTWRMWPHAAPTPASVQTPASPPGPPLAAKTDAKPAARLSIVVLPFANLSSDPEQGYFVDAITDDLTTELTRIPSSIVISRTTALVYKGKPVDVKQIGRDLGVRFVLEGSVRRLGEQVQVNVQLIDADTAAHVWADRFNTDRTNLGMAQKAITARLALSLRRQLQDIVGRRIEQESPANLDARDLIILGYALFARPRSVAELQETQRAFERALAMDPNSVDARVGIAMALTEFVVSNWSESREQDLARADEWLREALERDPNDSRAHSMLGKLRRVQGRLPEAVIEGEKTIALNPNDWNALMNLGIALSHLGRPEAALPYLEKLLQQSSQPRDLFFIYINLGFTHLLLGNAIEAVDFARKGLGEDPKVFPLVHLILAAGLGLRGELDEARAALAEAIRLQPKFASVTKVHAYLDRPDDKNPQYLALREKTFFAGLRRAGLSEE